MLHSEIKQAAEIAKRNLRRVRAEATASITVAQAGLTEIQDQCDHPNKFKTSHMGETGSHCPDCLRST